MELLPATISLDGSDYYLDAKTHSEIVALIKEKTTG